MGELLARVRAVLRRAQFTTGELASAGQSPMILGELSIDFGQCLVTMAGRKVVFTPTEYCILASLAHSIGQIVPQERLLEHAWGTAYVGEDQSTAAQTGI